MERITASMWLWILQVPTVPLESDTSLTINREATQVTAFSVMSTGPRIDCPVALVVLRTRVPFALPPPAATSSSSASIVFEASTWIFPSFDVSENCQDCP